MKRDIMKIYERGRAVLELRDDLTAEEFYLLHEMNHFESISIAFVSGYYLGMKAAERKAKNKKRAEKV